jgi:hypothetical protein
MPGVVTAYLTTAVPLDVVSLLARLTVVDAQRLPADERGSFEIDRCPTSS